MLSKDQQSHVAKSQGSYALRRPPSHDATRRVREVIRTFWALSAALLGMPIALVAVVVMSGMAIYRGMLAGDLTASLVVTAVAMSTLLTALAFAFLLYMLRQNEAEADRKRTLSGIDRDVRDIRSVMAASNTRRFMLKNEVSLWSSMAKGSVYTAVNPQFRCDVTNDREVDGRIVLQLDSVRIREIYVSRLHPDTGVARWRIFVFGPEPTPKAPPTEQMSTLLMAMRATREEAARIGQLVAMERVRIFVRPMTESCLSLFVGVKSTATGEQPVALSYVSAARDFTLSRLLIDEHVTLLEDPRDVDDLRHSVDDLCFAAKQYSLQQLEEIYSTHLDRKGGNSDVDDGIVSFDDHLSIK